MIREGHVSGSCADPRDHVTVPAHRPTGGNMRKAIRIGLVSAALAAMLGSVAPAANASTLTWECSTDGGSTWETFVVAPTAARHGLNTAQDATKNAMAVLGEICRVTES